jgi:hypothetical protein
VKIRLYKEHVGIGTSVRYAFLILDKAESVIVDNAMRYSSKAVALLAIEGVIVAFLGDFIAYDVQGRVQRIMRRDVIDETGEP